MKIAIIGAGISGLSCAYELTRLGYKPVIFEKTHQLGDKPGNLVVTLRLFQKNNPMDYLWKKYGINIVPIYPLKYMIVNTPNKSLNSKANHGYIFEKGRVENSLEHQLAGHAKLDIVFERNVNVKDIKNEFDHIVVASGNGDAATELGIWNSTFTSAVRIAIVSGQFRLNTLTMWLNKRYARNGYCYLLPRTTEEAELVVAVSDINKENLDFYWNAFIKGENIDCAIHKIHDINHEIGYPDVMKFENVYFAGNCAGMIDNFLGFGMLRAIESGFQAARSIAFNQDYNELMKPFLKEAKQLDEYRKMLNILTNKDYDKDLCILRLPGIKHFVYNNPLYKAKFGVLAPKLIYSYKSTRYKLQSKRPDT